MIREILSTRNYSNALEPNWLMSILSRFFSSTAPVEVEFLAYWIYCGSVARASCVKRYQPLRFCTDSEFSFQRSFTCASSTPSKSSINQSVEYGEALQLGCIKGNVAVVDNLLRAGADPNKVDEHGWTSLLCASQFQQDTVMERLSASGGDPSLAARNLTLPPTSWSVTDKSSRLVLDEDSMIIRYGDKHSLHLEDFLLTELFAKAQKAKEYRKRPQLELTTQFLSRILVSTLRLRS